MKEFQHYFQHDRLIGRLISWLTYVTRQKKNAENGVRN